jgi:hypothetical protein
MIGTLGCGRVARGVDVGEMAVVESVVRSSIRVVDLILAARRRTLNGRSGSFRDRYSGRRCDVCHFDFRRTARRNRISGAGQLEQLEYPKPPVMRLIRPKRRSHGQVSTSPSVPVKIGPRTGPMVLLCVVVERPRTAAQTRSGRDCFRNISLRGPNSVDEASALSKFRCDGC